MTEPASSVDEQVNNPSKSENDISDDESVTSDDRRGVSTESDLLNLVATLQINETTKSDETTNHEVSEAVKNTVDALNNGDIELKKAIASLNQSLENYSNGHANKVPTPSVSEPVSVDGILEDDKEDSTLKSSGDETIVETVDPVSDTSSSFVDDNDKLEDKVSNGDIIVPVNFISVTSNSHNNRPIRVEHVSTSSSFVDDNVASVVKTKFGKHKLNWIRSPPSPQRRCVSWLMARYPRAPPRDCLLQTDVNMVDITPCEYLIMWSNGVKSVAMLKNEKDCNDDDEIPLCVQLGGQWCEDETKSLSIGTTVMVRQYVLMRFHGGGVMPLQKRGIIFSGIMRAGAPYASAFATEWAIVTRPKILHSLGKVTRIFTGENKYGFTLKGTVFDVEHNVAVDVPDDMWPMYVREPPMENRPVVISWIKINELHAVHRGYEQDIIFPAWTTDDYQAVARYFNEYWLGWVDCRYV